MPDRFALRAKGLQREIVAARREAQIMRDYRLAQARQMIERRRPLMSTNFLK